MNNRKMTRTGAIALILVVLLVATSAFVSAQAAVQTSEVRSASVTGELAGQFSQHWLGVTPDQPNANLRFTLTFYPADDSIVRNNVGFWVMDEANVRAVVQTGGRFLDNHVAAGQQIAGARHGQLSAQITASGLAAHTIVVYNNSNTPVEYTLSVENGKIVDDSGQVQDASGEAAAMTAVAAAAPAAPAASAAVAATTAAPVTSINKTDTTTYTVASGDTLGRIATVTYGAISYYRPLCTFNEMTNCNLLEVGQVLQLPPTATLNELGGITVSPAAPAAAPAASAAVTTTTTTTTTSKAQAPTTPGEVNTYVVVAGDTLGTIAQAAYGNLQLYVQLCAYNELANCNLLEVGDEIRLPDLATLTAE